MRGSEVEASELRASEVEAPEVEGPERSIRVPFRAGTATRIVLSKPAKFSHRPNHAPGPGRNWPSVT